MGDWLGTGTVASFLREYRPFKKARAFVCGLGLKSQTEWRDYCKSGKKPNDIPSACRRWLGRIWRLAWDWHGRRATTARVGSSYRCVAEEIINHLEIVRLPTVKRASASALACRTGGDDHGFLIVAVADDEVFARTTHDQVVA